MDHGILQGKPFSSNKHCYSCFIAYYIAIWKLVTITNYDVLPTEKQVSKFDALADKPSPYLPRDFYVSDPIEKQTWSKASSQDLGVSPLEHAEDRFY